jgi:hypothetical protein
MESTLTIDWYENYCNYSRAFYERIDELGGNGGLVKME